MKVKLRTGVDAVRPTLPARATHRQRHRPRGMPMMDLQELLDRCAKDQPVPGAALAVLDGDVVTTAAFGVTNADHPLDVDADTLFQIGSITKLYVGTAVMRLVDRGNLELDAPV